LDDRLEIWDNPRHDFAMHGAKDAAMASSSQDPLRAGGSDSGITWTFERLITRVYIKQNQRRHLVQCLGSSCIIVLLKRVVGE